MPIRLRYSVRKDSAEAVKGLVYLVDEPTSMPKVVTKQFGDSLQDRLPLSIADPRRESLLGDISVDISRIDNHGALCRLTK